MPLYISRNSCLIIITLLSTLMACRMTSAGVVVNSFDDIVLWTGSGTNRAALVIDWADGSSPLAWGYRFDNATSADMLKAVVENDSRLFAKVQDFGAGLGWFAHGFGYDRNLEGFSISSGSDFGSAGFVFSNVYDDALATDPADSYRETDVFFSNYWDYWNGTGFVYPGAAWGSANAGISGRVLTNESWDGFSFNTAGFGNGLVPGTPNAAGSAVPEPTSFTLALIPTLMFLQRRSSIHRR